MDLTTEALLSNRIIGSYGNLRASGWTQEDAMNAIVADLREIGSSSAWGSSEDRRIARNMATYEKIRKVIDKAKRYSCPAHVLEELVRIAPSMYVNEDLARRRAREYFGQVDFPIFQECVYGPIAERIRGRPDKI